MHIAAGRISVGSALGQASDVNVRRLVCKVRPLRSRKADMYNIKVDPELLLYFSDELRNTAEQLICAYRKELEAVKMLDGCSGFEAELLAEEILRETARLEKLTEDILALRGRAEHAADIYERAVRKVTELISGLPVLIHGNISDRGKRSTALYVCGTAAVPRSILSDCPLICGNVIMHENWLLSLIISKKFGG